MRASSGVSGRPRTRRFPRPGLRPGPPGLRGGSVREVDRLVVVPRRPVGGPVKVLRLAQAVGLARALRLARVSSTSSGRPDVPPVRPVRPRRPAVCDSASRWASTVSAAARRRASDVGVQRERPGLVGAGVS